MKTSKIILLIVGVVILSIVFLNSNTEDTEHLVDADNDGSPFTQTEFTIEILPSEKNTYGYKIHSNERPLIVQPNIPALPGNLGFKTPEDAQNVAEFVVHKIKNGDFPPTVTIAELDSLGMID